MKLRFLSSVLLFALSTPAFASHDSKFYFGIFGGGGASNKLDASQFGTDYYAELDGGPLAINAFGQLGSKSLAFFGLQLGYQAQDIFLNSSHWALSPAAELEGYCTNKSTLNGTLINDTTRNKGRSFVVSYPMNRSVFLANAVLTFKNPGLILRPYVGLGIGSAVVRISNANSRQTDPAESINRYNSEPSDSTSTFAGQVKLGLSYEISKAISIFAEYRWLYLARTSFEFGSSVEPSHVETSSWQVKLAAQKYNLGNIGIRISL